MKRRLYIGSEFLLKCFVINVSMLLLSQVATGQDLVLDNYDKLRIEIGVGRYVGHHVDNGSNLSHLSFGNPSYGMPVPNGYELQFLYMVYSKKHYVLEAGIGSRLLRAHALFNIRAESDCFSTSDKDYIPLMAGGLINLILNASKTWDVSDSDHIRFSLGYLPHINTYPEITVLNRHSTDGRLNFVAWEDRQNQINHSIRLQAGYHKKFRRIILGLDVRYYHGFNPIIRADFAFGDDWFCEAEFGTYELKDDFLAIGLSIQLARSELASDND